MPEYLSPGVYVEETNTGNQPIEGVSTSTTGLVGMTERGPVNVPILVTSFPEYRRMFGGYLPIDQFTDPTTGRPHCFLPHAVEGFFTNGGKRAYVVRSLARGATRASRRLFFDDLKVGNPAATVLLHSAEEGTGTAGNPPLLHVISLPAPWLNPGDVIRIGDGSRAEYRNIAPGGVDVTPHHASLDLPLQNAHALGATVIDIARTLDVTPTGLFAKADFVLAAPVAKGATSVTLIAGSGGAPDLNLLFTTLSAPGALPELLEVNTAAANEAGTPTSPWPEYVYATSATEATVGGVTRSRSRSRRRCSEVIRLPSRRARS
jgi:hypothetical protein